jgi:hypothetical protein
MVLLKNKQWQKKKLVMMMEMMAAERGWRVSRLLLNGI